MCAHGHFYIHSILSNLTSVQVISFDMHTMHNVIQKVI